MPEEEIAEIKKAIQQTKEFNSNVLEKSMNRRQNSSVAAVSMRTTEN
tara:strand:- start:129 stop:269 length:141 start_codon:yes stop_codon:yes gene_type:complete